jgi:cycloeucalenol cycloisomerase
LPSPPCLGYDRPVAVATAIPAGGTATGLLSANPGKRAAERWYLLYTPLWGAVAGVVMAGGHGDLAFLVFGLALWLGVVAGGYLRRAPEDAGRPWWRLYHTKFQLWMFVFAFLGNYWSEYFYEVLHMHYGFRTRWNLHQVPFFLYPLTVVYFTTYGTLINVCRRAAAARLGASARWARAGVFVPVCLVVAALETILNANPMMHHLFCYEDLPFMLWFGTLVYGLWFVVTAPLWFPIDEEPGVDTPLAQVAQSALAGFMLVILVNELVRSGIAPLVTTVQRGAVGLDDFATSCLGR